MNKPVLAPQSFVYFELSKPEGDMRLEFRSSSMALSFEDTADQTASWRVRVYAKSSDPSMGFVDVGTVHTIPPAQGAPPNRVIAYLSIPGVVGYGIDVWTPVAAGQDPAAASVGLTECPYMGRPGLEATQWAMLEAERYGCSGGAVAPAFNGPIILAPNLIGATNARRLVTLAVWQRDDGCLVGPIQAYPAAIPAPGVIPIPPAGAITMRPAGGMALPVQCTVGVMGPNGGGWFAEWGE